jgi:outer membrane protein assembly factor BamB
VFAAAALGPGKVASAEEARPPAAGQAWRVGWPCYLGPSGNGGGVSSGLALVEDLAEARLVWSSEARIPHGKAHNPHTLPEDKGKPGGGGASPIVADGLVFLWYYQPCGPVDQVRFKSAASAEGSRYGGPKADENTWRIGADETIVAMDASTGKTVWTQTFADEGINIQSGKDAGISNHSMAYGEGKVYALGTMNRVYCLEARTGQLIWRGQNNSTPALEKAKALGLKNGRMVDKGGHSHEHGRGTSGLIVVGGVLMVPRGTHSGGGLIGLDAQTGAKLWDIADPIRGPSATPTWWTHRGKSYVIAANGAGRITCIEPRTGRLVWSHTGAGNNAQSVVAAGDYLVAKPRLLKTRDSRGQEKAEFKGPIGCYRLALDGPTLAWELPAGTYLWDEQVPAVADGHVYARLAKPSGGDAKGTPTGVCIELATGKVKGEFAAPFGGGDGSTVVADGRVIADQDASHNRTTLCFAKADPADLRSLGTQGWSPPHPQTSAYHPGIIHAYAAGRLFIRGAHAVHCYDLRKSP